MNQNEGKKNHVHPHRKLMHLAHLTILTKSGNQNGGVLLSFHIQGIKL
jgi:hypothetical protein